jgi:phosphonate transport system substrate-binding protein
MHLFSPGEPTKPCPVSLQVLINQIETRSGNRLFIRILVSSFFFAIAACNHSEPYPGPAYAKAPPQQQAVVYHFAVHPLYNPSQLIRAYQPLVDYLNQQIKEVHFVLEASRDYHRFEEKYRRREPEFILPNPLQTLQAIQSGYRVIAEAGNPADFKGIFIVRKDGPISQPSDLSGKVLSYPSSTALAACIMPEYFLYQRGIQVNKDIRAHYVGSQESSIMNVYLKNTVAGATWPPPWRAFQKKYPAEAAELKVIWETEPLINNSVMVRNDIPAGIVQVVLQCLISLNETQDGKAILASMETEYFRAAGNKDYDKVQRYINQFEREVHKIDTL